MKRNFLVSGLCPAYGQAVNDLVAACDLGIDGAFVRRSLPLVATMADDVPPEKLARQGMAIRAAFEVQGWRQVTVEEVTT